MKSLDQSNIRLNSHLIEIWMLHLIDVDVAFYMHLLPTSVIRFGRCKMRLERKNHTLFETTMVKIDIIMSE